MMLVDDLKVKLSGKQEEKDKLKRKRKNEAPNLELKGKKIRGTQGSPTMRDAADGEPTTIASAGHQGQPYTGASNPITVGAKRSRRMPTLVARTTDAARCHTQAMLTNYDLHLRSNNVGNNQESYNVASEEWSDSRNSTQGRIVGREQDRGGDNAQRGSGRGRARPQKVSAEDLDADLEKYHLERMHIK